ncbi:hypothetical protein F7725_013470, partial [Scomber scombrus]
MKRHPTAASRLSGQRKEISPPPKPQRLESADSAMPTSGPVARTILPTDRGLYITLPPDAETKSYLIATGSCRPTGPFPRDKMQGNRCFSDKYYTTTTKAGIKLPRPWLCYSPTLDCAYCEPCWLFSDRSAPFYSDAWVKGVRDWQHLSARIDSHAFDANMERDTRNATNYWRQ